MPPERPPFTKGPRCSGSGQAEALVRHLAISNGILRSNRIKTTRLSKTEANIIHGHRHTD